MTKTAVYRHYDADGCLLYVGITKNLGDRFRWHRARSPWANEVCHTRICWFASKLKAQKEERRAIKEERPRENKYAGASGNHPFHHIIDLWPSRQDMADDAGVDLYAVHRWYQRAAIPGKHDARLLAAAERRGLPLTWHDLANARCPQDEAAS